MKFLYLIILLPLTSFLFLSFSQNKFSKNIVSFIGVSSIGLSFLFTIFISYTFILNKYNYFSQTLWTWLICNQYKINITLFLDKLSLIMIIIITGVGFLIHIFSVWYMKKEKLGYSRFFAYTNLFIANMLLLVLANNMLLMYIGWEGVGLCSYLLISFYYEKKSNYIAAFKSFITTRIGDIFLIFAIFMLFNKLHTLDFLSMQKISYLYFRNENINLQIITLFILLGATGKSAQIPLHIWLPEAMVGPTPVSAMIHAATMVTAGVYLIARTYYLFLITNPYILEILSFIGLITLLLSSLAALIQNDVKKILAYSTMSQIGYMFLALGIKSLNAAIFHLTTHSFFKALLFLSAGSIIKSCKNEQNIFIIQKLKKNIPFVFFCFVVSGSSLSSIPFLTAGFFSKEKIIFSLFNYDFVFFLLGLMGSFLTSLYTFRMIFIIFYGHQSNNVYIKKNNSLFHTIPMTILLILSSFIGGLINISICQEFDNIIKIHNLYYETIIFIISGIISITGILLAKYIWLTPIFLLKQKKYFIKIKHLSTYICSFIYDGFNGIYKNLLIKPFLYIQQVLKQDPLTKIVHKLVFLIFFINKKINFFDNNKISLHIKSVISGTLIIIALIILT